MQLRYEMGLTGEHYVIARAWRDARLERCPHHPHGGCSLARHGTYERKEPEGVRVARWYCRESHTTFSLLPDCLAARLQGTLDDLEAVVVAAEGARSLEAANELRRPADDDAVELPGALRWVSRRVPEDGPCGTMGRPAPGRRSSPASAGYRNSAFCGSGIHVPRAAGRVPVRAGAEPIVTADRVAPHALRAAKAGSRGGRQGRYPT